MKPTNRYTVEPGRAIFRDGWPLIYITKEAFAASNTEIDTLTRLIVDLLNAHENRPAPSSTETDS